MISRSFTSGVKSSKKVMSKNSLVSQPEDTPRCSYGLGYVIDIDVPKVIIGKILTIIDVMGLTEKQNKSLKDLINQSVYGTINDYGIVINSDKHTSLREEYYKEESRLRVPTSSV
jgi:uncharacterized protein (DUF1499 family)